LERIGLIVSLAETSTGEEAPGALSGIRILDFTRMLAGPLCTALLADIGAEVIKIENRDGGDDARNFFPRKGNESTYFMLLNRGKKSLTIDLKSEKGLELIEALVKESDVVVENFRPGDAKRLGIDYARLSAINPRLIYASISGFGQRGPMSHQPAYDIIAQAMSGLMSVTGSPDGPPTRVGESFGDIIAGLYASWGILAALQASERTGRGQHLDVAMFDSLFSLLVTSRSQYFHRCRAAARRQPASDQHAI
jgi:CoA:oxalate CoA-transferase